MTAGQLQTMLVLFERVQAHTYRLMSTDSVPKARRRSRLWHACRSPCSLPPRYQFAKTAAYISYGRSRQTSSSTTDND